MKKKLQIILSTIFATGFLALAIASSEDKTVKNEAGETVPAVEILQHSAQYEGAMSAYTIHCRVKNNTDKLINYLDIVATFYDKEGKIVGTGLGNTTNFAGGSEKTIDVLGINVDNMDKYEVQIDQIMY